MNINEKRKEIDRLDIKISEHIDKRFDVVAEIAKIKAQNDINTEDKSRESEIISNIENSCNHINEITEIYKKIFELSKRLQFNIKSNIVGDDKCFLLGENVTSSFSPVIHAMFGNNNYFLNSVSADSLEIFLKSKQFRGANVTIPYKSTVIKHLDFLSAECALIGSVNTIKNCSGVLFGYNTDLFGMEYMLNRAKIDLKDKEVLILGSGATSKTAQFTTQKLKAKSIFFASRNSDINYDNIYEKCNPQVIINTTPVGMIGKCDDILVDIIRFKNLESVADVIYNPLNTRLLQSAKREGLKYTNGLSMLVAQASAANEIFFDEKSNSQKIEEAIRAVKSKMLNVALIGMPGSGKSVVGEKLAEMLSKTFIDIDKNLENSEKSAICDIFKKYGESKFRLLESEEIKNISKKTDAVISTGGGCVLNTENIVNLKKNAVIVWIKRDIDKLDKSNRPLSADINALIDMYEKRKLLYENSADIIVNNNNSVDIICERICEKLNEIANN